MYTDKNCIHSKGKVFWLTSFNTEDKRRNGDSRDIIIQLSGLILKTCLCCHFCPKSGLITENSLPLPHLSKSWLKLAYFISNFFHALVFPSVSRTWLTQGYLQIIIPSTVATCNYKWVYFASLFCGHLCLKCGLNCLCRWFISVKFEDKKPLDLKLLQVWTILAQVLLVEGKVLKFGLKLRIKRQMWQRIYGGKHLWKIVKNTFPVKFL